MAGYSSILGWIIPWIEINYFFKKKRDSQESSPTPQQKGNNFSALSLHYGPNLISMHDYCKNHSFDYTDFCWQSLCFLIFCPGLS